MVLSVNHRLSSTFSLLANYTWSKCLDELDNQGDESGVSGETQIIRAWTTAHAASITGTSQISSIVAKSGFHFNNRVESLVLNNWEFGGTVEHPYRFSF